MSSVQEESTEPIRQVEDPPRFSVEALEAGTLISETFRNQAPAVRKEILPALAETLTGAEARIVGFSPEEARDLAATLEENAQELRMYADTQERLASLPPYISSTTADDY